MSGPVQKPGKSKQTYGTPVALIDAVEKRWGPLVIDLAAEPETAKAPYLFTKEDDYLKQEWVKGAGLPDDALCWCNPPFEDIGPWAEKWDQDATKGARIISLVPASIGSEWFAEHVFGHAKVVGLRPRLAFQGCHVLFPRDHPRAGERKCVDPLCDGCATYPKDCMLMLWGKFEDPTDMFSIWRWKP